MSQRDDSNRYSPGGDLYAAITEQFGQVWANRAHAASLIDDGGKELRYVLNDARQSARGADPARPGSESTAGNFFDQIINDPLSAPLDALDNQLGNAVWNVVKNPFVLALVAGLFAFWLWPKLKKLLP